MGSTCSLRFSFTTIGKHVNAYNGVIPPKGYHSRMILSVQPFGITQILHALWRHDFSGQE